MSDNYLNIPFIWPFKMLPNTSTPGVNFDDDWHCRQIKAWQTKRYYNQKWIRSVTTKLQITSTLAPDDLKLYDVNKQLIKSFAWALVAVGTGGENAWECTFDVSAGVPLDGYYYLYLKAELLSTKFEAISESIYIKDSHPNLSFFEYWNTNNDFGMIWTTGIKMKFMCEAAVMDFNPENQRNSYTDQIHNNRIISAAPWRSFKLYIGDARGVAEYIVDILNRIFSCNRVYVNNLQYVAESGKWTINRIKPYPLIGADLDLTPADNLSVLQFNEITPLTPGVVMMYNIDTNFFGDATVVRITEINQT